MIDVTDLVILDRSGNRHLSRGFIASLDFQTIKAIVDATVSFRPRRPARSRTTLDWTLSHNLVFVIVRAAAFMALLMSSRASPVGLSPSSILIGIVAW